MSLLDTTAPDTTAPDTSAPDTSAPDTSVVERGEDWRDHAVCKGQLHLFFAKKAERPQARARREAKASRLCEVCPVIEPCREFARSNREYGFWAGESEEDRHLLGFTVTAPIGIRAREARLEAAAERRSA